MRIGLGGSAANPPHVGHKLLMESILSSRMFNLNVWIPSGIRKEKDDFIKPFFRKRMTEILFKETLSKYRDRFFIEYGDLYRDNTSTISWIEFYQKRYPQAEVIWYTGTDSVVPKDEYGGKCEIEAKWHRGEELMREHKFLIISRKGYVSPAFLKLPTQFKILYADLPNVSSTHIRRLIKNRDINYATFLTPELAQYIRKNKLYL